MKPFKIAIIVCSLIFGVSLMQVVQAGVWDDVKKTTKKLGQGVKKDSKQAGKAAKKAGQETKKETKKAYKDSKKHLEEVTE